MSPTFGVLDLFAGPGGLSEGFASFRAGARAPFQTCLSVEKEASAHRTLTLRAFLHSLQARFGAPPKAYVDFHAGRIPEPDWGDVDAESWAAAREKTWLMELGASAADEKIGAAIDQLRRRCDETVLIGGPPCQAYSLVGRARSKGKRDYVPEEDARHYLFREYIRVLERARPAAFVMENVKGMLSSRVESRRVFEMLMEDLSSLGKKGDALYELFAIRVEDGQAVLKTAKAPSDFIVRSEAFGVPQRRHRVIIIGLRSDVARNVGRARVSLPGAAPTVHEAIGDLPPLRSGLSRQREDDGLWRATAAQAADILAGLDFARSGPELRLRFAELSRRWRTEPSPGRASSALPQEYGRQASPLKVWLERPGMQALAQHETRSHMVADLGRYMFAAAFGEIFGFSPKATDFPPEVSPAHRNWRSGIFSDRFRVQLANEPSTTITSHISKDGHYFIHPDPMQCRSLTVREAARLQGFPDDYVFLGSRTEQYVQVGNAVPPLLAHGVAELVWGVLQGSADSQLPDRSSTRQPQGSCPPSALSGCSGS